MKRTFLCIFTFTSLILVGQKDSTKLQINQVEVIKYFEANLEDAQRVAIKPVLPPAPDFNPKYKYDITIVPVELKYPDPQIKPLAMNPDGPFKVSNGYLQAAYGLRSNPEFMGGYHTSRKDVYQAGVHLDYASLDNSNNQPFQKYRNATLGLYGSYMVKENTMLYGDVSTSFRKRYFYHTGLPVDSLYSEDESVRTLNSYSIKAGIKNAEPTKFQINYDLNLTLRNMVLSDKNIRENGMNVQGKVEKIFKKSTVLSLDGTFDYSAYNGLKELSLTTGSFTPVLKTKFGQLIFHGGANLLYSSDGNSSVFPEILLSYGIAGPSLQVFAGVHQGYYTNNFTNVTQTNPYLADITDSLQNTVYQEYSGGIKGSFSFLTYQVKAGWKNIKNQMFLLNNNKTDIRYFDMLYDDMGMVFISGNLDFAISEKLSAGGWLTQNIYNPKTFEKAWHIPNLEANAYASAHFMDNKLKLRSDLYFGNGVPFINKNDVTVTSNVLLDFNLNAEYYITEKFNIFIKGINLFNNKFERWYGYPSVGINGMVGGRIIF